MAASQDLTTLSDDEIVALLAKKQAALKEAKEAQAKAASKQAETKAADQKQTNNATANAGDTRPAWVQQVVPKKMPGFSTWFLPLLLLYSTRESLSHEQFLAAIVMLAVAVLQGQRFIEWMEDSEWRKKLREEAHARCIRDKKDEDKGKERTERREGSGSTKKAAPKPKKVD